MNIRELVKKHGAQKADRDADYCDAYEKHFSGLRESTARLLEIGVKDGASLRMWKEYFPNAEIWGLDVDKKCMRYQENRIRIIIGNQGDKWFLGQISSGSVKDDIIIDDGSHKVSDQWLSFRYLFKTLRPGGLYVIEDLHTSYWPRFGGGINNSNMMCGLLDAMHARHWKRNERAKKLSVDQPMTYIEQNIKAMHFYDSICFIERKLWLS